jgi:drug/metabolite transporter (DMT)-like permease
MTAGTQAAGPGVQKARAARRDPAGGFLFALIGTALVSTNFVTAKYALRGFDPMTFSTVWTAAGALFALVFLLVSGKTSALALPRRAPWKTLLLGLLTAAGMLLTWAGLARLDPSFAAFLWRFMPALLLVFGAVFLRERITWIELLPVALMLGGGVFGALGRWEIVGAGVILTVIATFAGAGQMLLAKLLVGTHDPLGVVFYRLAPGALFIAVFTAASGGFDFDVAPRYWLVCFLGAFLGPSLSHVFQFEAYRRWDLSRAGIVLTLQPLFVLPLALAFLGAAPAPRELAGGAVILAGALWLAFLHVKRAGRSEPQGDAS